MAAGLSQGGWLQALLLATRLLHGSITPLLCSILTKSCLARERGFSSPLAPLGFLPPPVLLLLVFPRGAAALLLALHLCKPWGCQTLVCLGLACPQPQAKPSRCSPELAPPLLALPQQHTSIHPVLFEAL